MSKITVTSLNYAYLMSPEYGTTATATLDNGIFIKIYRYGKLDGTVPAGEKEGKYIISHWINKIEQMPSSPMTGDEANQYIEALERIVVEAD